MIHQVINYCIEVVLVRPVIYAISYRPVFSVSLESLAKVAAYVQVIDWESD